MKITVPEKDFILIQDIVTESQASLLVQETLKQGLDPLRGFSNPSLKPNRFGNELRYPIKKYMCYGLYWDPLTYLYMEKIPEKNVESFSIPKFFLDLSRSAVKDHFPHHEKNFRLDSGLVNFYCKDQNGRESKLHFHRDKEEADHLFPVMGFSFGSEAQFVYQNSRGEEKEIIVPDRSLYLFGDSMRLMRHGVKNVRAKTVPAYYEGLFQSKERLNFTFRKVHAS